MRDLPSQTNINFFLFCRVVTDAAMWVVYTMAARLSKLCVTSPPNWRDGKCCQVTNSEERKRLGIPALGNGDHHSPRIWQPKKKKKSKRNRVNDEKEEKGGGKGEWGREAEKERNQEEEIMQTEQKPACALNFELLPSFFSHFFLLCSL
jgi:hypothetical protein